MEDKWIKAVKNWLEPISIRDIQVFIGFANFYWRFIQGFNRIATPLISILKIIESSKESALKTFKADDNKIVGGGSSRANKTVRNSFKKLMCVPNIRATREPNFLIPNTRKAFNHLRLAFIKALILWYFDAECHI